MELQLESMAVEMPQVEGHPNRCGFRGVLTTVDRASDRAPSGARGHRVMLTAEAAEAALPSLLGMAVDYAPELDRHDARRKAGIITDAELRNLATGGQCIAVRGYIFARDFPEVIEAVREMGRAELGMSYEIADVRVADVNAEVWRVTQFAFTGAAVLKRGRAAYRDTWLELEN